MDTVKVAVIGAGPSGISMLKTLKEDGFAVTCYERRSRVGGLWAYTENPEYTTALKSTVTNISKFTCGYSDYPMPDKYPTHMKPMHFQEFMEGYAKHFDVLKDIVFNATVREIRRDEAHQHWLIDYEQDGQSHTAQYDKIAICNGYQTKARIPTFPNQEIFTGRIIHHQAYRDRESYRDKTVIVVGLRASAGDILPDLAPVAKKLYVSHRRGAALFGRFFRGRPIDLSVSWRRRRFAMALQKYVPAFARWCGDASVRLVSWLQFGRLDPAWGLTPFPCVSLNLPAPFEGVIPLLRDGTVTSKPGIKRFAGPRTIEFTDGTVVDDVDDVVLCTGYGADFSLVAPFIEKNRPEDCPWYKGADMHRLYMNIFPPKYANSCALLCYSLFGKSNGFSFADVSSMAVSNVFRGVERQPSINDMERWVDEHQRWLTTRWKLDPLVDVSMVKQWEFQTWLHQAAGTGMAENLGWGWKGWAFWWRDRELCRLMLDGPETAHGYRVFETGRRKTWEGAREAILHVNEVIKAFPLTAEEEKLALLGEKLLGVKPQITHGGSLSPMLTSQLVP